MTLASRRDACRSPWVRRAIAGDLPAKSFDATAPIAQVRTAIMGSAKPRVTVALEETAETAEFLARVTGHAFDADPEAPGRCYCGAGRYATCHMNAYGRPIAGDEDWLPDDWADGAYASDGEPF